MSDDAPLLSIAEQVAEGELIDWITAGSQLPADDDRQLLSRLEIIAKIAALHANGQPTTAVAADTDITSGRRWGHLRLLELVGEGTFGELYRAWDETLDREVAVKLIKPGVVNDDQALDEARLLARVRHPNVATVYGAERIDGRAGIWMEFIHGRTLSQMVTEHGAYNATEASVIGRDICRALAAVHSAGLLHRDVKARNVMRERGGRIVLTDFGAGLDRAQIDGAASLAGTPHYLAPEMLLTGAAPSVQSDIYAVGVLLFRLVADAYPVAGATLDDVRDAHRAGRRQLLRDLRSDLPNAFIAAIERATAADPAARFDTAGALEQRLTTGASVLTEASPSSSAPAVSTPSVRPIWRRWWLAATVLILAAVLAGAWQIFRPPQFNLGPEHLATQNDPAQNVVAFASGFHSGRTDDESGRFTFNVTNNFPRLFHWQPWIAPDGNLGYKTATNAVGIAVVTVTLTDHRRPFGFSATSAPKAFEIRVTPPRHPPVAADDRFETAPESPLVVGRQPMPPGIRHWWRGDGSAVDSATNGADGKLQNGAGFAVGRSGQAFAFDGVDDILTTGGNAGNFGADDFSISFLIKTSAQHGQPVFNKMPRCGPSESFWAVLVSYPAGGTLGGGVAFNSNSADLKTQGSVYSVRRVNDSNLHSVAIVRSGTVLSIYVDGVFDNMAVTPVPLVLSNATELRFGTSVCADAVRPNAPGGERPFSGLIDEVTFFDRALAAHEIQRLHHHGVLVNDTNSEHDLMTAVLAKEPAHGTLALSPDGTFTYHPAPGFTGTDRFGYQARNAIASSGDNTSGNVSPVATVTIDVRPPGSPGQTRR